MNLNYLQEIQPKYDHLQIFNQFQEKDGVLIQFLGFLLKAGKLSLYALQWDQSTQEKKSEVECEAEELPSELLHKVSKHNKQLYDLNRDVPLQRIRMMTVDGQELNISGTNTSCIFNCASQDILLINEFLKHGLVPNQDFAQLAFEAMIFTEVIFDGHFEEFPVTKNSKHIHFTRSISAKFYPFYKKFKLKIGTDSQPTFICGKGKDAFQVHINRVFLMDLQEEMLKSFSQPKLLDQYPAEEVERMKEESLHHIRQICPDGMLYPVIEYETEAASVHFCTSEYLDTFFAESSSFNAGPSLIQEVSSLSKESLASSTVALSSEEASASTVAASSSPEETFSPSMEVSKSTCISMVIFHKPDKAIGTHGLTLRGSVLSTAVTPDTTDLDVGIMDYSLPFKEEDFEFTIQ